MLSASCSGLLAPTIGAVMAGFEITQRMASVAMLNTGVGGDLAQPLDGLELLSCQ